jgi:thiol:disulfide interchange protein
MKIIMIGAKWCVSCLIMDERLDKVTKKMMIKDIKKYDYDNDVKKIEDWNVEDILPVIILLNENNNEIMRLIGEKSEKDLKKAIESVNSNYLL